MRVKRTLFGKRYYGVRDTFMGRMFDKDWFAWLVTLTGIVCMYIISIM